MIFDEKDLLYILVEFDSDRISPRESAKNGRNGAHGLNFKIFVNFEFRFKIYDKNYPMKKNFMPLRPFWNFRHPTWLVPKYNKIFQSASHRCSGLGYWWYRKSNKLWWLEKRDVYCSIYTVLLHGSNSDVLYFTLYSNEQLSHDNSGRLYEKFINNLLWNDFRRRLCFFAIKFHRYQYFGFGSAFLFLCRFSNKEFTENGWKQRVTAEINFERRFLSMGIKMYQNKRSSPQYIFGRKWNFLPNVFFEDLDETIRLVVLITTFII